jgi:hypothetical protein
MDLARGLRLHAKPRGEHGSEACDEGAAVHLFNNLIRPQ